MGFTANGHPADEDSPVSLADMIGHYKRSKFMAEQVAMEAGRSGMRVVTVNPTTPVGEQDVKPTPTGRIVVDFLKGQISRLRGDGTESSGCKGMRARDTLQRWKKARPASATFWAVENLTLKQILDKLGADLGLALAKSETARTLLPM